MDTSEVKLSRIGLFGGTFNPIHFGHLRVAVEVRERFALDRVFFIQAALPPHKQPDGVADAPDRLAMTRMAVAGNDAFVLSTVELDRPGPSYTIDTVNHFRSILPAGATPFFILGLDAFLEINTWKSFRELLRLIPFIVMARPSVADHGEPFKVKRLEAFLTERISGGYAFSESQGGYIHPENQPVFILNVSLLDISSTQIRRLVRSGRSIKYLVPDAVEAYIQTKGLYL